MIPLLLIICIQKLRPTRIVPLVTASCVSLFWNVICNLGFIVTSQTQHETYATREGCWHSASRLAIFNNLFTFSDLNYCEKWRFSLNLRLRSGYSTVRTYWLLCRVNEAGEEHCRSGLLLQMYPKSSTGKMESSNRWCPLSWRFRNTSYLNGNCLSEGKKCIDFLTEDRNTLISSDYTEPHNGVRMLRPTIHTEFKHCKSNSNKNLNKQKR